MTLSKHGFRARCPKIKPARMLQERDYLLYLNWKGLQRTLSINSSLYSTFYYFSVSFFLPQCNLKRRRRRSLRDVTSSLFSLLDHIFRRQLHMSSTRHTLVEFITIYSVLKKEPFLMLPQDTCFKVNSLGAVWIPPQLSSFM